MTAAPGGIPVVVKVVVASTPSLNSYSVVSVT